MPLQKQLLEVPAGDGLSQKFDPRSLPVGKSALAINLVKDKMGALTKRLGLFKLTMTDPFGSGFSLTRGVKLANYGDDLLVVGRGLWSGTGATVTCLQTQSDDLGGMVNRGPMPDLKIISDEITCNSLEPASSPGQTGTDDYLVKAWIEGNTINTPPFTGNVFWTAIERSTGNIIAARVLMAAAPPEATFLRLAVVGKTFIMCWSTSANTIIQCATMTEAQLIAGTGWVNAHSGGIITSNQAQANAFDMRAATGDTLNFAIAYVTGVRDNINVVVDKRAVATPNTLTAQWIAENITNSNAVTALGLRTDVGTTNSVPVAYCSFGGGGYVIRAAIGHYPSMTTSATPTSIYGSPFGTTLEDANPPVWIDVTYGGFAGQTQGKPTWTTSHSPLGACWIAWSAIPQSQAGGTGAAGRLAAGPPDSSYDARIIQNQFYNNAGAVAGWGNTSGTNALTTPGVTLASRGCEANGIAYFLGWVPSLTQGSFLVLAYDLAQNPAITAGNTVPMRPVGTLQTRTVNADPGIGASAASSITSPNDWTGGSEWTLTSDDYGTALVSYVGGTRGERLQPATGTLQMQPATGFPWAQWGTMTAFGGALPTVFAGQNAVEQGFLWTPESVVAILGVSQGTDPTTGVFWINADDSYTWIFCWEWFDEKGNFHQSARSPPVTVTGRDVAVGGTIGGTSASPGTPAAPLAVYNPTFYIPSLGCTLRQWALLATSMFGPSTSTAPSQPPTLGVYRTGISTGPDASTYFRINDRFYNGADPLTGTGPGTLPALVPNAFPLGFLGPFEVNIVDNVQDGGTNGALAGAINPGLTDGTHPLLYDDGTDGAPGSLDQYNPPSSNVLVRHKERLWVARGNQLLFTKSRGDLAGPGYNEQVDSVYAGNDDDIIGLASMDGNLVILKAAENYYIDGNGPAEDGSGSSFSQPQPIPTDVGCLRPEGVIYGPEGVYYQSSAGLRRISRSLSVDYVGGPVEDELRENPVILDCVFYPQNNRILFLANESDSSGEANLTGEVVVRDYALDAWTTTVVSQPVGDGATAQIGFVSAAAATGAGTGHPPFFTVPPIVCMHFLAADGTVWREHNPLDELAYYDENIYVSSVWLCPVFYAPASQQQAASKQGRFRLWDILAFMQSNSPHGLIISVGIDQGTPGVNRTWVWNNGTSIGSIAPGGVIPTPLTQLRTYDGRMGEAFQVQLQDVADPASTNGQGATFYSLTLALGVYPGPYKLPASATQ